MLADEFLIDRIETWACRLPLSQPLDFGRFEIRERHHTAMRMRTRDGRKADCVTQGRGSPLDVVAAELIAPRLIGKSAVDIHARRQELRDSLAAVEFDGAVGRAWSLAEICMQDLRAQAAELPLWQLLGGARRSAPVQLIEGYALVGENDVRFAQRLASRVDEGYRLIKIEAAHYDDIDALIRRLRAFRRLAGEEPRLVLDFAWSWTEPQRYVDALKRFEELGIEWLEDPFSRCQIEDYVALRKLSRVPIGCGDEASRAADIGALIAANALDVVRLDATTIGGVTSILEITTECRKRGVRLSFHEHPEVHEHCVFGFLSADHVEVFPADRPFDRVHDLLESTPFQRIRDGVLSAPDEPGTGIRLRDGALGDWAWRHSLVGAD